MFNLLSENEKRALHREYAWRRSVIYVLGAIAMVVIACGLLVPVLVVSYYKSKAAAEQYDILVQGQISTDQVHIENIERANGLVEALKEGQTISTIDIIRKIVDARPRGVTISAISYAKTDAVEIRVQGIAGNRDVLRLFSKTLGEVRGFAVDALPISNFVMDSNLPFSIRILLTPHYYE